MPNQPQIENNEQSTEQQTINYKNLYISYLFLPPGVTIARNAIMFHGHPFNSSYSDSDYCQELLTRNTIHPYPIYVPGSYPSFGASCTSIEFNGAWWREVMSPMLGYILFLSGLWITQKITDYILDTAEKNKSSWTLQQTATAINSLYSKLEPNNFFKFFALCISIGLLEDLLGAACVNKIDSIESAVTMANTQALVSAAVPTTACVLYGLHKAKKHAMLKFRPKTPATVPLLTADPESEAPYLTQRNSL